MTKFKSKDKTRELRKGRGSKAPTGHSKGPKSTSKVPTWKEDGKFNKGITLGAEYRWQPGQSGNPSGRPKKSLIDSALEALLAEPIRRKSKHPERTKARLLAKAILKHALKGNFKFAQLAAEREGGKPMQPIDMNAKIDAMPNDPQFLKARIHELLSKRKERGK